MAEHLEPLGVTQHKLALAIDSRPSSGRFNRWSAPDKRLVLAARLIDTKLNKHRFGIRGEHKNRRDTPAGGVLGGRAVGC
jgi:hypothetical protein